MPARLDLLTVTAIAASVLAAGAMSVQAAPAAGENSEQQLAAQAHYWEGRNRLDLARESWLKLLRTSPDSAAALAGLARDESMSGRPAAAQVYLDRLKQSHPNYSGLPALETAIQETSVDQDRLSVPRTLAREGHYDEAVKAYHGIYGDKPPTGRLGLEYYQTLAGSTNGWAPARAGIESLVNQYPDDPVYRLALAQHLTYREETRRQGVTQLEALSHNPEVGEPAREAWRQALVWMGQGAGDEGYYKAYVDRFGHDEDVDRKLGAAHHNAVAQGGPGRGPVTRVVTQQEIRGIRDRQAYDALNAGNLDAASARFQQILAQDPHNADALGGMGIIRLREQRYAEAVGLLDQARAAEPARAGRWTQARASARFWGQVREAEAARASGRTSDAVRIYRDAIESSPATADSAPSVQVSLADLLVQRGDMSEAETLYNRVLRRHPGDLDATRGLIGLYGQTGRLDKALALAETLPKERRDELGSYSALRAQALRAAAEAADNAGQENRAEMLLRQALLLDPENAYTRMDLARVYQRQHRTRDANTLIDGLLASNPDLPDALYVKAVVLGDQQDWAGGMQVLDRIPAAKRTQPMYDLQERYWIQYQIERASALIKAGRPTEAQAILNQLQPLAGRNPQYMALVADAYAQSGDDRDALAYMRDAIANSDSPRANAGLRLQYAGLLFKLHQDAEFETVMDDLLRHDHLTAQQNLDLANLRIGYRLRQADAAREEGDLGRAYQYLEPLARVNPNDPRVELALARMYNDSHEYDRALAIDLHVVQQDPNNVDAYKGGINAALALDQVDTADTLLAPALQLDPNDAQLYAMAGRAAKARGDDGHAIQLFEQALRMERGTTGTAANYPTDLNSPHLELLDPAGGATGAAVSGGTPRGRPMRWRHASAFHRGGLRAAVWHAGDGFRFVRVSDPVQAPADSAAPAGAPPPPPGTWYRSGGAGGNSASYVFQPDPGAAPPPPAYLPGGEPVGTPPPQLYTPPPAANQLPPPPGSSTTQEGPPPVDPLDVQPDLILRRSGPKTEQQDLQQQISELRARRSDYVGAGLDLRNRDGQEGLGQLLDIEFPVEASLATTYAGDFRIRAVPVILDAGTLSGAANVASFGSLGRLPPASPILFQSFDQNTSGASIEGVYEKGDFHADFGTTPLGFPLETVVGGLRWSPRFGRSSLRIDISRRPVTDSLLSYAGVRDPGTGLDWGGVRRNGGRVDWSYDLGHYGVYLNGDYYLVDGKHVQTNHEYGAGGGAYVKAISRPGFEVTVGANLTTFFFNRNLSGFTYGQGGYFSPQHYYNFGFPIALTGGNRRFAYIVHGSVGIQSFKQDGSPIYPLDPNFVAASPVENAGTNGTFLGRTHTGIGGDFGAGVEYLLDRNISVGGRVMFNNARDYNEESGLAYLRFYFEPQEHVSSPPHYLYPFYNYEQDRYQ